MTKVKTDLTVQMIEKFHDELLHGEETANKTFDALKARGVTVKQVGDTLGYFRGGELLVAIDADRFAGENDNTASRAVFEKYGNEAEEFSL